MTLVLDAIAREIAALERETDTPVPPFGYGSDLACRTDLEDDMREVDPMSVDALAEALLRRLDCPRGALPGDADYGIDVRSYLNRGTTDAERIRIETEIAAELTKDDRVSNVQVTVTQSADALSMRIGVLVVPVDPATETFRLTFAVTSAEVVLEELLAA